MANVQSILTVSALGQLARRCARKCSVKKWHSPVLARNARLVTAIRCHASLGLTPVRLPLPHATLALVNETCTLEELSLVMAQLLTASASFNVRPDLVDQTLQLLHRCYALRMAVSCSVVVRKMWTAMERGRHVLMTAATGRFLSMLNKAALGSDAPLLQVTHGRVLPDKATVHPTWTVLEIGEAATAIV
jgi:hypothetical protein